MILKTVLPAAIFLLLLTPAIGAQSQVRDRIEREAEEFRIEDVRLLDGPFKNAMIRDAAYLLRLDADRLLSGFRKEAGLKPKGEANYKKELERVRKLEALTIDFVQPGETKLESEHNLQGERRLLRRENY